MFPCLQVQLFSTLSWLRFMLRASFRIWKVLNSEQNMKYVNLIYWLFHQSLEWVSKFNSKKNGKLIPAERNVSQGEQSDGWMEFITNWCMKRKWIIEFCYLHWFTQFFLSVLFCHTRKKNISWILLNHWWNFTEKTKRNAITFLSIEMF